jgi:hypothetical protein
MMICEYQCQMEAVAPKRSDNREDYSTNPYRRRHPKTLNPVYYFNHHFRFASYVPAL